MNRNEFENSLLRQARRLKEYVDIVYKNVLPQADRLPVKEIWDAQKIFISGCGDSWMAGIAAKLLWVVATVILWFADRKKAEQETGMETKPEP